MGSHPVNLVFRFLLELIALFGLGVWGWHRTEAPLHYLLAVGLPLIAGILWAIFAVPGDPTRSGRAPVAVPGLVRLALELLVFGVGALALWEVGFGRAGPVFAVMVAFHYAISHDRIGWLVRR